MVYALSARSVAGTSATCRRSSQRLTAPASGLRRQCVGWRGANAVDSLGHHSVPSFRTAVSAVRIGRRRSGARQSLHVRAVFEKFTERSIKIVMLAQQEARNLGSMEVRTEHIVVALTSEDPHFLLSTSGGIHVDAVRGAVATIIGKKKRRDIKTSELPFARDAKRVFETASAESRRMGLKFISPEHLEVAVLSSSEPSCRRVYDLLAVDPERLRNEAKKRILEEQGKEQVPSMKETAASGKVSPKKDGAAKALDEFCRDVCQDAREGRIDPIVGRDSELARTVQILARRTKNNPILLGEAGVGKTAIAEGLALAIVTGRTPDGLPLPPFLEEKRVLQLDLPKVLAGAKDRGELESRVTKIIAETKASPDVVLFIDEVHTLIGAGAVSRSGGSGSGLDVSNLMKPALARGELQCIGATTLDEFRKYIEKDAALERRFQPVYVEEPTNEQALAILGCLKATYERHHHCVYTSDALEAAVTLSRRYIMDRYLPDKAIDLLDEAGSRSRIAAFRARQRMGHCVTMGDEDRLLEALYIELTQVLDAKEEAVREGRYEEAHLLAAREGDLKGRLQGSPAEAPLLTVVKPDDIQAVVSAWTGVPADRLCEDERAKLLALEPELMKTVIGQSEAVEHTAAALRRARSGFRSTDRPIATLLFSGPTGVGKTLLAKELADKYFASPDSLISLDMSEYMERHMVSKLIGAPPGYVGYGEGGKLTEAVRRRPFCVLLLDEIEKAHPDVFNILLQVIEDGRLTDSQGRVVSFKNCLIIMTTNLGSNVIAKGGTRLGFHLSSHDPAEDSYQRIRGLVGEELKSCFRPELLNRIDEIIVFRQLQTQEMREIADLMLAETAERMAARDIGLQVTARCMDSIMESGFSQEWGARELRRAITHLVDDSLSDALLCGKIAAGDIAVVDVNAEGKVVVYETKEYLLELVKQQGQIIDIAYSSEPSKLPMEQVRA